MVWWHTKDIKISSLLQRVFAVWMEMSILVLKMLLWRQDKIHISLVNSRRDSFVNFGQFVLIMRLVSMVWITLHLSILCTPSVLCWIVKFSQIWQLQTHRFLLRSLILLNNLKSKKTLSIWEGFFKNIILTSSSAYTIFLCFSIRLVYSSLTMNTINQLLALDLSLLQSARWLVWVQYARLIQIWGELIVFFWAGVLIGFWLYGVYKKDNEYKKKALTIFFTIVGVFWVYAVVNLGVPQWRPGAMEISGAIAPLIPHPADNSFPSGHALFAGALLVALLRYFRYYSCLVTSTTVLAIITLTARVIGGIHYPGDIVAGLLFWSIGAYFLRSGIDKLVRKVAPIFIKIASYIRL